MTVLGLGTPDANFAVWRVLVGGHLIKVLCSVSSVWPALVCLFGHGGRVRVALEVGSA